MAKQVYTVVTATLLLLLSGAAAAHSLQVFAMAEGDRITGRAYFAGGHPARGVQVRVLGAAGDELVVLTPDADGRFAYRPRHARDLLVVAQSADGHRAEWPIAASELAGAFAGSAMPAAATAAPESEQGQEQEPPRELGSGQASVDEGLLSATVASDHASETQGRERATASGQVFDAKRPVLGTKPQSPPARLDPAVAAEIERAVARQVRPLREALAQAQGRAQLRDILGGVGYILGIAGIGIWWSARQRRRRDAASEGHG